MKTKMDLWKTILLGISILIYSGSCVEESATVKNSTSPTSESETVTPLVLSFHDDCFLLYRDCNNGSCEYGVPCNCTAMGCLTPEGNHLNVQGKNESSESIVVKQMVTTFTDTIGRTLASLDCHWNQFTVPPSSQFGTLSEGDCLIEDKTRSGFFYLPLDFDPANSSLTYKVQYQDSDGHERSSSSSRSLEIVDDKSK